MTTSGMGGRPFEGRYLVFIARLGTQFSLLSLIAFYYRIEVLSIRGYLLTLRIKVINFVNPSSLVPILFFSNL